jgi:2,4-dienoyl-CoA reductase-like NADH-dependent reductase (Old Yellow Enzyme family)
MKNPLEPISFRQGIQSKNRVALAAMTNSQSHADGSLSDDELRWLEARADGGFGIITTCASHVAKDGQGWKGELGIFDDSHVPGLRKLNDAMQARGALCFAQIFHGGLRADPTLTGERAWTASPKESDTNLRRATDDDIQRVIAQFGNAAHRAHAAGMDGVEIHGAHGYLLTQFLSATENTRADAWGGSIENRARLIREVMRAVRSQVPSSFVVGVRLSPEDFGNAKGLDLDESLTVARWLCEDGADFLHLSLWDSKRMSQKRPEAHAVPQFRAVMPDDVRIIVAGKIWTMDDAQRLLELGADVVALGRSAIANPDWPLRAADPAWEPKRPPLTPEELLERGLSAQFVEYMRAWKGFVTPTEPS